MTFFWNHRIRTLAWALIVSFGLSMGDARAFPSPGCHCHQPLFQPADGLDQFRGKRPANAAASIFFGYPAAVQVGMDPSRTTFMTESEQHHKIWLTAREKHNPFPLVPALANGETRTVIVPAWSHSTDNGLLLNLMATDSSMRFQRYNLSMYAGFLGVVTTLFVIIGVLSFLLRKSKNMERRLRGSEVSFLQIAENMGDVFWLCSADDGKTLYISPAYEKVFNRPCQDIYANPKSFIDAIHPEDRGPITAEYQREIIEKDDGRFDRECRIVRPDGEVRWIWARAFPLKNIQGETVHVAGIADDITARKLCEAETLFQKNLLTSLLDSIPDIIFFKDRNGIYLGCNPAFERIIKIPREKVLGKTDAELFDPRIASEFINNDQRVIRQERPSINEETMLYPDGRKLDVETLKVPLRGAEGQVIGVLGISRDISIRKQAEEDSKNLEKMKSDFLTIAAHEMRTPLTTIIGFSEIITSRSGLAQEKIREFVEIINHQARHMAGIVDDFLDIVHIESGGDLVLEQKSVELAALLQNRVKVRQIMHPDFEFSIQGEGFQLWASVDEKRMTRVLDNILDNAVKFSLANKVVAIVLEQTEECGLIKITDRGKGMNDKEVHNIFATFYRANHGNAQVSGKGLGMSIVRHVVEAHGGRVAVHSQPGLGTTVSLQLPKSQPSVTANQAEQS